MNLLRIVPAKHIQKTSSFMYVLATEANLDPRDLPERIAFHRTGIEGRIFRKMTLASDGGWNYYDKDGRMLWVVNL